MSHSWELTDEQKKEINEKNRELASQYDPETGKKKNVENTGDDEPIERQRGGGREAREPKDDDENIR